MCNLRESYCVCVYDIKLFLVREKRLRMDIRGQNACTFRRAIVTFYGPSPPNKRVVIYQTPFIKTQEFRGRAFLLRQIIIRDVVGNRASLDFVSYLYVRELFRKFVDNITSLVFIQSFTRFYEC